MKKVFEHISCKDKEFSRAEYESLRSEMNMRVNMAYAHGFTLATIMLVFWAAIFAFCKDLFDLATASDSIIGKSAIIDIIIVFAVVFFCSIPCLLVYPFSVKYNDNIRQIVNIASYLRVFYEYPSMIRKEKKTEEGTAQVIGWEVLHCNHNIPKGNMLAFEYVIIAIGSIVLSTILGIALFGCIFGSTKLFESPEHYLITQPAVSYSICILGAVLCAGYLGFLYRVARLCRKHVKIDDLFEKFGKKYFEVYLQEAIDLKILSQDEAAELKEYMCEAEKRDRDIFCELKK